MAVSYPRVRDTSHEPSYYGAGFGLCMAVRLDLGSTTRVVSFSSRMGYGASNYYGTRYEGPCTGYPALMRGAIWLNRPQKLSKDSFTAPDFTSDNIENIASGGYLEGNGKGNPGTAIKFGEFTWTFTDAVCDRSVVWVGWIHDRYDDDNNNTCVAFASTASSGDDWSRLAFNTPNLESTSLRFGFTSFNATEPYKPPTITISNNDVQISRYDVQRSIHIGKNESGDTSDTTVKVKINGNEETTDIGNSESNYNFTPSAKGVSDGASYQASATRTHNSNTSLSASAGPITLYTYRTPKISDISVNPNNFSGIGNATLSWYTNGRRWTTNPTENEFKTYIKFENKNWFESSNNEPSAASSSNTPVQQSQTISADIINNKFTQAERSAESISTKIYVRRTNPSSQVNADSSGVAVTIQLKPKYSPSNVKYFNNSTNVELIKGSLVYTDVCPKIKITWTYPNNADRGVISGYIIRIYSDSARTNLVSTHTLETTALSGEKVVNTKTDLKRGQLNYISIVAYYTKPNGTGNLEGPALNEDFVIPIGRLHKPVIAYPITNTTWHNDNFRVLLQSPKDDDDDVYTQAELDNYRYRNIEIKINNQTFALNGSTEQGSSNIISASSIFCNAIVKYQHKICINPSLDTNFITGNTYKISIRYQKNYFQYIWSEWSNEVTLNKSTISELSEIHIDEPILAAHYNKMRNYSVRLWNVYPLQALEEKNAIREPSTSTSTQNDLITQDNYAAIYSTILGIKNKVNAYPNSFDTNRENVKFNQVIDKLSPPNGVTEDLVTADKDARPIKPGRNYINILIECMNKLF